MRVSDAFPSKFFRGGDLSGREVTLTISGCRLEMIGDRNPEEKLVLRFIEDNRGLVLNKGNSLTLAEWYGDECDDWPGQLVTLFSANTEYQGQSMQGIRVKIPPADAKPAPMANGSPAPSVADLNAELNAAGDAAQDGEVPF